MYLLYFIAKNNLKKKKGEVVVLFFLIALAALLLYTSISVLTGVGPVLDSAYERADTADLMFITNVEKEKIKEIFLEQEEVIEYEMSQCLFMEAEFRKDKSGEKNNFLFIIGAMDDERTIGRLPEQAQSSVEYHAVLLPYYLKFSFAEGDSFYLTLGGQEYEFTVSGFVEDPLSSTPLNISSYSIYITRSCLDDLMQTNPSVASGMSWQHKVHLKEGIDTAEFDEKISPILIKAIPGISNTKNMGINWMGMRSGAGVLSNISMGIILIFSILLIAVVLIIVRYSIRNFLEINMKNIGILQASGYTIRQLRKVSVLEIGFIAFWGVLAGIVLGILGNGVIGSIEGRMIGLSWSRQFNPYIALLTAAVIFITVTGVAIMAGRVYGKVTVLNALRGGIHTHNFRRNYFALEKSRLPLSIVLSGKNIMGEKRKNFSILFIIIILSLTTCIGFALYENFAMDTEAVLNMAGVEGGNVSVSGENLEKSGKAMEGWEEIESVLYYCEMNIKLTHEKKQRSVSCDIWKEPEKVRHEMLVKGRLPEYDNEIVMTTTLAEALGVDEGDVVYIEGVGERLDYIVSGIDQKINHLGIKAILTMEGLERLNGDAEVSALYIYTKTGTSFENIQKKIEHQFPGLHVSNSEQTISEMVSGIEIGMAVICMIFSAITFFVVTMVEVLLIHAKVMKEQKNYGINKAIGYTTGQLVRQTMMMNMPVMIMGSVAGAALSTFLINPLTVAFFSIFGIKKCDLFVSPVCMVLTVAGIVAAAIATSFLASVRIRKIEPVRMLAEE